MELSSAKVSDGALGICVEVVEEGGGRWDGRREVKAAAAPAQPTLVSADIPCANPGRDLRCAPRLLVASPARIKSRESIRWRFDFLTTLILWSRLLGCISFDYSSKTTASSFLQTTSHPSRNIQHLYQHGTRQTNRFRRPRPGRQINAMRFPRLVTPSARARRATPALPRPHDAHRADDQRVPDGRERAGGPCHPFAVFGESVGSCVSPSCLKPSLYLA